VVDDPNRDTPSAPGEQDPLAPMAPTTPPTRRQLRESEARARAREEAENRGEVAPDFVAPPAPYVAPDIVPAPAATPGPVAARSSAESKRATAAPTVAANAEDATDTEDERGEFSWLLDQPATSTAPAQKKRKKRFVWVWVLVALLVLAGGAATAAWVMFEDEVRSVLGIELPNDYEGTGNGEEVIVTVVEGDVGGDIATKLSEAGVTMTYDAFYDLLVSQSVQPTFMPGSYPLQKEMSAQSALDVLADSANIVTSRVLITEGSTITQTLNSLSEGTGIPLADFEAAAADPTAFGVPATAPSLEGWLFPATYDFIPGSTAPQILQTMADRMVQALDEAGVAVDDRERVLTLASIVQKEGGSIEDFPIVARLFLNRLALEQPMNLESDATVAYGTGNTSIHTTADEREDASNPYNTYANPGLPVGPISAPGDDAILSVVNPAEGDWLFMVLVNGETGETVFSDNYEDHLVAVEQWGEWYEAHPGWDN
jgi:UPF0755 protein